MENEPVALGELAREWGIDRGSARRYARKRGFTHFVIVRRDATHQAAHALLAEDAEQLREIRRSEGFSFPKPEIHSESR
jgi:hypothetical protein